MAVTTTSARQGGFEIRFWHRVFEEEVARVKGGFGPCNTSVSALSRALEAQSLISRFRSLAVHPQSKGYSIGGEDGYVRVHQSVCSYHCDLYSSTDSSTRNSFDDDFFTAKPCAYSLLTYIHSTPPSTAC